MIGERWIENDVQGSGRGRGRIQVTVRNIAS
jgi:hypothetical protein